MVCKGSCICEPRCKLPHSDKDQDRSFNWLHFCFFKNVWLTGVRLADLVHRSTQRWKAISAIFRAQLHSGAVLFLAFRVMVAAVFVVTCTQYLMRWK